MLWHLANYLGKTIILCVGGFSRIVRGGSCCDGPVSCSHTREKVAPPMTTFRKQFSSLVETVEIS